MHLNTWTIKMEFMHQPNFKIRYSIQWSFPDFFSDSTSTFERFRIAGCGSQHRVVPSERSGTAEGGALWDFFCFLVPRGAVWSFRFVFFWWRFFRVICWDEVYVPLMINNSVISLCVFITKIPWIFPFSIILRSLVIFQWWYNVKERIMVLGIPL